MTTEAPLERFVKQQCFAGIFEELADDLSGQVAIDVHGHQASDDSAGAVTPDLRFSTCHHHGGTPIVDDALGQEPRDRRFDGARRETLA